MNPADLLVIGGGFAGLTAALRARELGLRVTLLESGDGERYPCNSRMSGGIVHVCFLDIRRTPEELYTGILTATAGEVNTAQAKALSENAGRLVDWWQQHGARFMRFSMQEAYRWCLAPPRSVKPGPDWIDRGPDVTLRELMRRFREAGGNVLLRTRARQLRMAAGACAGVTADSDDGQVEFESSAVLIADGGFQADRDSFVEHIGPNFEAVFQRGASTGFGNGMRMAAAAGARLTSLRPFYGHLLAREAHHNEKLWPYPELDAFATSGIIVGPDGLRFTNEGNGGIAVANALARLDDPAAMVAIFDANIWEGPGKAHRIPANPLLEQAGATIHRANTIEELARLAGLPPQALADTVSNYNLAVERGELAALAPPRGGKVKAMPIRTAPFMAMNIVPGITYTMGGIEIDGSARVVSTDGTPIKGLFAAGAATGGLEGGGTNTYVGGIVKAGVFGLLAAEEAARTVRRSDAPAAPEQRVDRFPLLTFTVRHGRKAAAVLSALVAAICLWLFWPALSWFALPAASLVAGLAYVLIRSYVEIVTLITEMLMPQ